MFSCRKVLEPGCVLKHDRCIILRKSSNNCTCIRSCPFPTISLRVLWSCLLMVAGRLSNQAPSSTCLHHPSDACVSQKESSRPWLWDTETESHAQLPENIFDNAIETAMLHHLLFRCPLALSLYAAWLELSGSTRCALFPRHMLGPVAGPL